jgi:hypothetical protein
MTPAEARDLLVTAEAATADAADAYRDLAVAAQEPLDYRLSMQLANARHYLSAALVTAGLVLMAPPA